MYVYVCICMYTVYPRATPESAACGGVGRSGQVVARVGERHRGGDARRTTHRGAVERVRVVARLGQLVGAAKADHVGHDHAAARRDERWHELSVEVPAESAQHSVRACGASRSQAPPTCARERTAAWPSGELGGWPTTVRGTATFHARSVESVVYPAQYMCIFYPPGRGTSCM